MNREIKFRAWIPKPKTYAYSDNEKQTEGGVMFYQNDQYLQSFLRRANMMASEMEHDSYVGKEDLILLQYTGLKDKNGKEIYEGDLLRRDGEDWVDSIDFKDGSYRFVNEDFSLANYIDVLDELEVIGNIYENPDLL